MLILNGKRVYAAINIYAPDDAYDDIAEQAKILDEIGVDGIIASDGGVVDEIKKAAPNTPIHISTQANTISYHSANFWYKNGAKRVILGREMSKEEIKTLIENKAEDLEVEIFAHGALCFGYSGRCFLSEFLAGRNGNLGDCAQSCRWAYNVYVEETNKPGNLMPVEHDEKGTYIFSSKDLCLIKEIPEIIEMGVNSIKIEGRLKTEYYLASVINAYRNAIDDYYKDPQNYDYTKYLKELEKTKTRGLTTFYFNDKNNQDIHDYEGHQYNSNFEFGGKVIEDREDRILIEIRNKLSLGDTLELIVPGKTEPIVFKIQKLWNDETEEPIETVNPGKAEQKVILNKPSVDFKIEKDWILRRMK